MPRKFLAVLVLAIVAPLALAACGSSSDSTSTAASSSTTESTTAASTTASGGGGQTVAIGETEYKLDPSDPSVKAGSVTFDVSNDGSTVHNLTIEGNGIEEQATDDLQPGDSGDLTVDLKPGKYEIYCSIDGHKDLGMDGEVTVQ
ncbi:MAG: hypothetical protein QOI10_1031 [Solirubrobacterales bacterium]|nr:hypothetical protein [Solirubrobacterales bacterium]